MFEFRGKLKDLLKTDTEKCYALFEITATDKDLNALTEKVQYDVTEIDLTVAKHREKRSVDANAYFHLLVGKLASELKISEKECKKKMVLDYGVPDQDAKGVKIGFKMLEDIPVDNFITYPKIIGVCTENGRKFNKIIVYKHTHLYNTEEMSNLIEGVVQECEEHGIQTKTPNEIKDLLSLWETQRTKYVEGDNV